MSLARCCSCRSAAVTFGFDSYEDLVKPAFDRLGYALQSIHRFDNPLVAIEEAEAIAIGGGNTFALLKRLYDAGIVDAIRAEGDGRYSLHGMECGK